MQAIHHATTNGYGHGYGGGGGSRTSTMSAMTGVTGTTATPAGSVVGSGRKRKRQMHVTYTETTEVGDDGRLRDVIVIEDTPPANGHLLAPAAATPILAPGPGSVRTRAQAAAAAAAASGTLGAAAKKRKREEDDTGAGPSKKPALSIVKQWQTSATDDSAASFKGAPPTCDDKEGHYIVNEGDIIFQRYRTVRLLGQGTFGKVVEAVDTRRNAAVAIKIIRAVPKYRDASKIEIRVVQKLKDRDPENKHRCVHLLDWFDHRNHICLVFELLGMCVYDFLKENDFAPFPRHHIQAFARQLLDSVAFLHDLHLIHTDLKPENILLVRNDFRTVPIVGARGSQPRTKRILNSTEIRLIDFGSATFQDEYHSSVVSTRHYRAPEIILGLGWSYPCDAFSLGCILVEFYTGMALFQTHDNLEHLAMMEQVMGRMPERYARIGHRAKDEFFKDSPTGIKLAWPTLKTTRQSKKEVKATRPLAEIVPPIDVVNRHFVDLIRRLLMFDSGVRMTVREACGHLYLQTPVPPEANDF